MVVRIGCVVEGHGERESAPILIRRIAAEFDPIIEVSVPHPVRMARSKLLKPGELERAIELAATNAGPIGGILVLLDSDDDCPAELGPKLWQRVRAARGDMPSAVVLARREFESWFLASARSLRGQRGYPEDMQSPPAPETIRGAKEWLAARSRYAPSVDQAALTSRFDLKLARSAPSFDRCYREVTRLLAALRTSS